MWRSQPSLRLNPHELVPHTHLIPGSSGKTSGAFGGYAAREPKSGRTSQVRYTRDGVDRGSDG